MNLHDQKVEKIEGEISHGWKEFNSEKYKKLKDKWIRGKERRNFGEYRSEVSNWLNLMHIGSSARLVRND